MIVKALSQRDELPITACHKGCYRVTIMLNRTARVSTFMTVTSNHLTRQRSAQSATSNIVSLPASRSVSARKFIRTGVGTDRSTIAYPASAELFSVRQHLTWVAAIGLSDLVRLERECSAGLVDDILHCVRVLLHKEFGHLRVHRKHQSFIVSHHCMESLLAGLLRVQYHSQQINSSTTAEDNAVHGDSHGPSRLSLTWGVGKSRAEAESQRHCGMLRL